MGIPSKVRIASLADEVPEPVVAGVDIREVEADGMTWFEVVAERKLSSV
jgi:hypothetical protein